MGVFQFYTWLRARHPNAFRNSKKVRRLQRSVNERQRQSSNNSGGAAGADSDSDGDTTKNINQQEQQKQQQQQQQQQQDQQARSTVVNNDDYAVVCIDINAMLHEVATGVTTEWQHQPERLRYRVVEQEILRRLRAMIEDLIIIAGGETLQPRYESDDVFQRNLSSMKPGTAAGAATGAGGAGDSGGSKTAATSNESNVVKCFDDVIAKTVQLQSKQQQDENDEDGDGASSAAAGGGFSTQYVRSPSSSSNSNNNNNNNNDADTVSGQTSDNSGPLIQLDVLLVVDGAAPLGKIVQQRERRGTRRKATAAGGPAGAGGASSSSSAAGAGAASSSFSAFHSAESAMWDTNAITVGTQFMQQVCALIHYIAARLVHRFGNLRAFVSDATVPGEGEQKIFCALKSGILCATPHPALGPRDQRRLCICSNDTDSVVMALLLSDDEAIGRSIDVWRTPSTTAMTTSVMIPPPSSSSSSSRAGGGAAAAAAATLAGRGGAASQQQQQLSWIFDVDIFVSELKRDFLWTDSTASAAAGAGGGGALPRPPQQQHGGAVVSSTRGRRTFGGAMKSFAFMLALFGGDFLPRVADLAIADGDLDDVIEVLATELFVRDRWIVDPVSGAVDLHAALYALKCVADRKYSIEVVGGGGGGGGAQQQQQAAPPAAAGARRARTGQPALTVMLGNDDALNPFSAESNNNNNSAAGASSATAELVSQFWEGLVWVGRYFDGVTASWTWFFSHFDAGLAGTAGAAAAAGGGSGHGGGAHSQSPRLRDLVNHPAAITGKATEMAARVAIVYQSLQKRFDAMRVRHRGHHGHPRDPQQEQRAAAAARAATTADTATIISADDANPLAVAAAVLPDTSWSALLPRAVCQALTAANTRFFQARTEHHNILQKQQQQQRNQSSSSPVASSPSSSPLATAASPLSAAPSAASSPSSPASPLALAVPAVFDAQFLVDTSTSATERAALEFIQLVRVRPTDFDPVVAVRAAAALVRVVQHRFSPEDHKLLKQRRMYRLNWARIVGDPGRRDEEQEALVIDGLWEKKVLNVNYSNVLRLWASSSSSSDSASSAFANSSAQNQQHQQQQEGNSTLPRLLQQQQSADGSSNKFDELVELVGEIAAVEESALAATVKEEDRKRNNNRNNENDDDDDDDEEDDDDDDDDGGNNDTAASGSAFTEEKYVVPSAITFTGTPTVSLLTEYPAFSNVPVSRVAASSSSSSSTASSSRSHIGGGSNHAIMFIEAVSLPM